MSALEVLGWVGTICLALVIASLTGAVVVAAFRAVFKKDK